MGAMYEKKYEKRSHDDGANSPIIMVVELRLEVLSVSESNSHLTQGYNIKQSFAC